MTRAGNQSQLWPANSGHIDTSHQNLTSSRLQRFTHSRETEPCGGDDEERLPVGSAKHACETTAINIDHLAHFATFAYPHASSVRDIRVPNGVLSIDADAVGNTIAEISPHAPIL